MLVETELQDTVYFLLKSAIRRTHPDTGWSVTNEGFGVWSQKESRETSAYWKGSCFSSPGNGCHLAPKAKCVSVLFSELLEVLFQVKSSEVSKVVIDSIFKRLNCPPAPSMGWKEQPTPAPGWKGSVPSLNHYTSTNPGSLNCSPHSMKASNQDTKGKNYTETVSTMEPALICSDS